ncbi:site-specific integrase [Lysinibacillus sp. BW-2-10]|uniref:tyrosine-type recombinase/integrase n=1 Tax=Lysinibacillus sp. BW-2-10 TaxID=2590030 RepID=UPI00117DFF1F|nr:site-specific integrase [Lysinibacillus sp. BW-2-10]TSI07903.1 site-specific integrase [Lysinibacillus sp. BW-2-10]
MGDNQIIPLSSLQTNQKLENTLQQMVQQKIEMYRPDFSKFSAFCQDENRTPDFDALEKYLHHSIVDQRVKLSTFNRRLAGVQFYLTHVFELTQTEEQKKRIKFIRQLYNTEDYIRLKAMRGVRAERQEEVLQLINKYDTSQKCDIRKRAICFVNLITANRPSEMVRLKVADFDLEHRIVFVVLKKQGETKEKRLTLECVKAIEKYMKTHDLKPTDYFVGAADRWGNYRNRMITERSYNRLIHEWLGFAPYTLRKTQITHMHRKHADLPTIAKQSGHKSLQTISQHYLEVDYSDVDDFL